MRAADTGIDDIYGLGVPITTKGPYPTSCSLLTPHRDSSRSRGPYSQEGVPILPVKWGRGVPILPGLWGRGPHFTGIMGTGVPILGGLHFTVTPGVAVAYT